MRHYEWSTAKNDLLKAERHVSFEAVVAAIQEGRTLSNEAHTNKVRYGHQRVYVVQIEEYAYLVPYVQKDDNTIFFKTIIPSRVATKRYLKGDKQ